VAQPLISIGRKGGIAKRPKSYGNDRWRIPTTGPPGVFARDGLRSDSAAIRELQGEGFYTAGADHAGDHTVITASNLIIGMESAIAGDARAANDGNRLGGDSGDQGGKHDSKKTGPRNHPAEPARAGMGVRISPGTQTGHSIDK
jgi:hypothetical protein